jgi:hypothetical protein
MNKSLSEHTLFYYKVQLHVSAASCSRHQAILKPIERKKYKIVCLVDDMYVSFYRFYLQEAGPAGSSETSVSHHLTPRNNREDGRVQFNHGGSLRYRIVPGKH